MPAADLPAVAHDSSQLASCNNSSAGQVEPALAASSLAAVPSGSDIVADHAGPLHSNVHFSTGSRRSNKSSQRYGQPSAASSNSIAAVVEPALAASYPAAVPPGSVTAVITTTAIPTMIGAPVNAGLASRVDSRLLGLEPRRSAACMTSGAQPWNKLDFRSPAAKARPRRFGGDDVDPALTRPLLLVLNGGSNTDPNAMASRLAHTLDEQNNVGKWPVAPCAGDNYDPVNGEQFDLVDDHVMDELRRDVAAGVYAAAYACQKQSTFVPQKRAMGPHPYRSAEGAGR